MGLNIPSSNFTYSDHKVELSLIGCCLNEDLQISCSEWIDTKDYIFSANICHSEHNLSCSKLNILVEEMLKQIF